MIPTRLAHVATAVGLCACLASTVAALPFDEEPLPTVPVHHNRIPWPVEFANAGPFGPAVTGVWLPDVTWSSVLLKDGLPYHLFSPLYYSGIVPIDGTSAPFTALAVYPFGNEGVRDALLASGVGGLYQLTYVEGTQTWDEEKLAGVDWEHAPRIMVGDADGQGREIIGLAADGLSILRVQLVEPDAGNQTSMPLLKPAIDFRLADFYAGGDQEIIAVTSEGLHVYDLAGQLLDDLRQYHPGGALTVVSDDVGPDRIAWLMHNPAGTRYLLQMFDEFGLAPPLPLDVPIDTSTVSVDIVGVQSADWNGDGWGDLVIPQRSFRKVLILLGSAGASNFSLDEEGTDHVLIDVDEIPTAPATGNASVFGFGALNRTQRHGVVAPLDVTQDIAVLRQPSPLEQDTWSIGPQPGQGQDESLVGDGSPGFFRVESAFDFNNGVGTLNLFLENVPDALLDAYQYIQVVIWHQDDPRTAPPPAPWLDENGYLNQLYDIVDPSSPRQQITIDFDDGIVEDYWADMRHRYIQLRFVNLDPAAPPHRILTSSFNIMLGMALKAHASDAEFAEYLVTLASKTGTIDLDRGNDPLALNLGGEELGAIIVLDYIPPFEPGRFPNPGAVDPHIREATPWDEY